MRWRSIGAGVTLFLCSLQVAACASGHDQAKQATPPTGSPFSLYTHCGIDETRIGNAYYVAEKPLSDGHGNPPAGWDNPFQQGTITITSASTAVFRDSKHHEVRFRIRPRATRYLQICS